LAAPLPPPPADDTPRWFFPATAAGATFVIAVAIGFALAVERPAGLLVDAFGPYGMIFLLVAPLLCWAAAYLRGADRKTRPGPLLFFWVLLRLAFLPAVIILLIAWLGAWATGLAAAPALLQAFIFALVGASFSFLLSSCLLNLARAIRGPNRAPPSAS
jgi:hypothetical protein